MAKFIFYSTKVGYGSDEIKEKFGKMKNVLIVDELEIEDDAARKMVKMDSKMKVGEAMQKFFVLRDKMKKEAGKKVNKKGKIVIVISNSHFRMKDDKSTLGMFVSESPKKELEKHSGHTEYGKKILGQVMKKYGEKIPDWKLMFLMGAEYGLFPVKVAQMQKDEKKMIVQAKKLGYKFLPLQKIISEMEKLVKEN